jgi:hypothetical protein
VGGERRASEEQPAAVPDAGVVLRPEAQVLGDEALVPEQNVARPPPTRFTHELVADEPYRFDRPGPPGEPDGVLPAGTRVVLVVEGPERCRVVEGSGLSVEVRRASLRELPPA